MILSLLTNRMISQTGLGIVFCVLQLQFLVETSFAFAQGSDKLASQFLDQAPPSWNEYRTLADKLEGSFRRKVTKTINGRKTRSVYSFTFKHNGACKLLWRRSLLKDKQDQSVKAYNPTYVFSLKRKNANTAWIVTAVEKRENKATSTAVSEMEDYRHQLRFLTHSYMSDLTELVKQPDFRIIRAQPVKRQGVDLVQIDFDNTHELSDNKFFAIQSGSMILDPKQHWCLRECDLKTKHPTAEGRIKVKNELATRSSEYPVPKRRFETHDIVMKGVGNIHMKKELSFDFLQPSVLPPDEEFTLSAFGLPEPFGMASRPTPWYIWAGGLGIISLVAGVLIFWKKQRTQNRS